MGGDKPNHIWGTHMEVNQEEDGDSRTDASLGSTGLKNAEAKTPTGRRVEFDWVRSKPHGPSAGTGEETGISRTTH